MPLTSPLLRAGLLTLLLSASLATAQTCPCYGAFTCQGNCAGSVCCNFGCTDYASDPFNCGACGRSCGTNSTCVNGACRCVTGTSRPCYSGPFGTGGVGVCTGGMQACTADVWGVCMGEVTPTTEVCNGLDDDCDGRADNVPGSTSPLSRDCYSGPPGTRDVGACRGGRQLCERPDSGSPGYGACLGEVTPSATVDCGPGDAGTGSDGGVDAGNVCGGICYGGPPGTAGVGVCRAGVLDCGDAGSTCRGQVLPGPRHCGGQDYDCDGVIDTACPPDKACSNGICVPPVCGDLEFGAPCPTGYACVNGGCEAEPCAGGGICAAGSVCVLGACRVPCGGACTTGQVCFNDRCVTDDCTSFPCSLGAVCVAGRCQMDPCLAVSCPATQQCRAGACEPSCAGVTCPAGERCGAGGTCRPDPCVAVTCQAPKVCSNGACVDDPCAAVTCPPAQRCEAGGCVADECLEVSCPAGARCMRGICNGGTPQQPDAGSPGEPAADAGGGGDTKAKGCGCDGTGDLALVMAGLFALIRRRKRPASREKNRC